MALTVLTFAALSALLATRWLVHTAPAQREPSVVPITYRPGSAPAVPRVGGAAVFIAVLVALAGSALIGNVGVDMLLHYGRLYGSVLAGGTLILAVGLADDFLDLTPAVKFVAQGIAAAFACVGGLSLHQIAIGPHLTVSMGWFGVPLTLFWIVAVTNAFNFIDGLDGLAAGIGIVGFGATAVSALVFKRPDVVLVSIAVIGALLGFLRYNFAPARIYLGDCGSLFIGYLLAVLSLVGATSPRTGSLVYVPVFALGLPLLDGAVAITRRWLRGAPIWKGDHRHIHHRVQALGLSKRESLATLMSAAGLIASVGLVTSFARPGLFGVTAALGCGATLALLAFGLWRLDYYEFAAVASFARAPLTGWRRFVGEEIRLLEAEREIANANNLDDLRSTLERSALAFGLDRIEITRSQPKFRRSLQSHLDIALNTAGARGAEVWNLRVWHADDVGPDAARIARVAGALSASCAGWLRDFGMAPAGARVDPFASSPPRMRERRAFPRRRLLKA
jgi:UDP-GlcNAc:undecaprenyl-phosphate/decaprenyl-phosphate GlcNAc-1-phosphate transferase